MFKKCSFTFTNLNHRTYFSIHNVVVIVIGSIKFLFSNIKITTIADDLVPNWIQAPTTCQVAHFTYSFPFHFGEIPMKNRERILQVPFNKWWDWESHETYWSEWWKHLDSKTSLPSPYSAAGCPWAPQTLVWLQVIF